MNSLSVENEIFKRFSYILYFLNRHSLIKIGKANTQYKVDKSTVKRLTYSSVVTKF